MATQRSVITNHDVNRVLETFLSQFDKPTLVDKLSLLTPEQRAAVLRGQIFARQLKSQLQSSSDSGVILSSLGSIQAGFQNALNELNAFTDDSNPGHVDNYASHLDGAITQATPAFFEQRTKGDKRYGESLASVEQAAIGALSAIEKRRGEIAAKLEEANSQISTQAQVVADASAKINEKVDEGSAAIRGFIEKFDALSGEQRRELREHLENQRTAFATQADILTKSGDLEIANFKA